MDVKGIRIGTRETYHVEKVTGLSLPTIMIIETIMLNEKYYCHLKCKYGHESKNRI